MSLLLPTNLEDHLTGTVNTGGIINSNWHQINNIIGNTGSGAGIFYTALQNAIGGGEVAKRMQLVDHSANYTLQASDINNAVKHPAADTAARVFTVEDESLVPAELMSTITIINEAGAGVVTIAINVNTLTLEGAGTTGSRTLTAPGIAVLTKVSAGQWYIHGTGLT